jgi:mannan endo-1,4-beta-mannosidase
MFRPLLSYFLLALTATSVFGNPVPADTARSVEERDAEPAAAKASFVGRSGTHFTLNGKPFYFGGTNAYWLAQSSNADIDKVFADIKAQGLTVVRTWAFNDVTNTQNWGAYYQLWKNGVATINNGPNGLDRLDYVVAAADRAGVKLILALVNNWSDYGGMDVYVSQLGGGTHDTFYTSSRVQTAYKNYVKTIVNRYKSSTAVMAWELTNEARCGGSNGSPSSSCTTSTITNWVNTMSAYVKSLDSNHLVALGDEGFLKVSGTNEYVRNGGAGVDFQANLKLSSIDFGTFHMYPQGWGTNGQEMGAWGSQWIQDHANIQNSVGKPVILEEFGVNSDDATQLKYYTTWYSKVESTNLAGVAIWQFGDSLSTGNSPDDGHTIYPSQTSLVNLVKKDAATQAGKNK